MTHLLENSSKQIAELERRLSELDKEKSYLQLTNRLLTSLSPIAGLDNLVQHILETLMQTIGGNNIAIVFHFESNWQYRDSHGEKHLYQQPENDCLDRVLSSGKPQQISSSLSCQSWGYPLLAHGQTIGAVCLEGVQLNATSLFNELQPFFVYAGVMLANETSNHTRLAEAKKQHQSTENHYRALFDQSPDGIILWSVPDLIPLQFNKSAHIQLGYSREEFSTLSITDIHPVNSSDNITDILKKISREKTLDIDTIHYTKYGERRNVSVKLRLFQMADKEIILSIHRDETERWKAEEGKALMNFALGKSYENVHLLNRNARLIYANEAFCRSHGYSEEDLIGMGIEQIDPIFQIEHWEEHWQELKKQGFMAFESKHKDSTGRIFPVNVTGNYFEFNGTGYCLSISQDLTEIQRAEKERISLEKKMLHTQKLESLGVLAGGIAHDFNNLLAAIMGHAELSKRRLNPQSPAIDNLKQIELAAERAADLAKQMLAYSGKGRFIIESIDLNQLLNEMLHMLEVSISKRAVLRFNLFQPLPTVEADATQLRQIIMNLVINASEAIGDKSGTIAITTGCMDCDSKYLKDTWLDETMQDGLYVYLEIADTGCGMDKKTLDKLFDPFFTTKFTGRGLGMSATLGIVRGHKGGIKVYSEAGEGTTFKILLPASNRPAELFNVEELSEDWQGSGKVLLVDDEETIRGIGTEMLKELGFKTLTAENGRDALDVFQSNSDIDLVILDLTMPHMDGEQCFRQLKKLKPDVCVILSSGYNEYEVTQKFIAKGLAGFIQKPYKFSTLREVIRKALQR